jgi:quinol-cytochrome oxidoreductase complex cytochrome b subunit
MNFPDTKLNHVLMFIMVMIGFFATFLPLTNRKPEDMTVRRWVIFAAGLIIFFGGWLVLFYWLPDSTFHCTQHCFPWGD